jgi:16S rRNA (adenine1518-N6/adenine1519-N6)-dimethyltransferase
MRTQIDLLKEYGIAIRGNLGQHLLIDPNLQRKTVELLNPVKGESVFEIGPGLGALTGQMLARGMRVTAVEKDARFVEVLKEVFAAEIEDGRLEIHHDDALEADFEKILGRKPCKILSNLPYYITAPLLFKICENRKLFTRGVFTMQLEVADRIFAGPGSKDYGRLSLMMRLFADVAPGFDVSPRCFTPPPQVKSSVVVFDFHQRDDFDGLTAEEVSEFIKAAFSHRRKKLISVLAQSTRGKTKEEWAAAFEKLGIDPGVRSEQLLLKDFLALAAQVKAPKDGRRLD